MGSTVKGKNLLPRVDLLELIPFQKGPGEQESKQKVTKVVLLLKITVLVWF